MYNRNSHMQQPTLNAGAQYIHAPPFLYLVGQLTTYSPSIVIILQPEFSKRNNGCCFPLALYHVPRVFFELTRASSQYHNLSACLFTKLS
jgi:hypothetical protein